MISVMYRDSDIWEFSNPTLPAGGVVTNEERASTYIHLYNNVDSYYDVCKCKLYSFEVDFFT